MTPSLLSAGPPGPSTSPPPPVGPTTAPAPPASGSGAEDRRDSSLKGGRRGNSALLGQGKQLAASVTTSGTDVSPEATLVDFISTSASFFGIRKRSFNRLEREILQVGPNNIMPANAAAWYLAKKRKFQLLPYVLKKYREKFLVSGSHVEFKETYEKDFARQKLHDMTRLGLLAYFSHKVEEYGVYLFDPRYYETVEPFRAGLQAVTGTKNALEDSLLTEFFKEVGYLQLQSVSPFLMALAPKDYPLEVRANVVGVVTERIDEEHGLLKFSTGDGTAKAIFSVKSLFKDRLPYKGGDILTLPELTFDGYRLARRMFTESGQKYSWAAVLVWSGMKPSPKYNSTKVNLLGPQSTPRVANTFDELVSKLGNFSLQQGQLLRSTTLLPGDVKTAVMPSNLYQPGVNECMQVGEVREILNDGALISLGNDEDGEKAFVCGWRLKRRRPAQLTTAQGTTLEVGDLVGYYLDKQSYAPRELGGTAMGHNIVKLRSAGVQKRKQNSKVTAAGANSGSDKPKKNKSKPSEPEKQARQRKPRTKSTTSVSSAKDTAEKQAVKRATAKGPRIPSENSVRFLLEDPLDVESVNSNGLGNDCFQFKAYSDGYISEDEKDFLKTDLDNIDPVKLREELLQKAKELREKKETLKKLLSENKVAASANDSKQGEKNAAAATADGLSVAKEADAAAAAKNLFADSVSVTVQGDKVDEDAAKATE